MTMFGRKGKESFIAKLKLEIKIETKGLIVKILGMQNQSDLVGNLILVWMEERRAILASL